MEIDRSIDKKSPEYVKYSEYCLMKSELRLNKYPNTGWTICKDYKRSQDWQRLQNKPESWKVLSVDCEMVETAAGYELARISIINFEYETIYESLVKPTNPIINYHTNFSGIDKSTLELVTKNLAAVQADLERIFDADTILVGHSLDNDLHSMKIIHERVIDTSVLFITRKGSKLPLKGLAYNHLKFQIQSVDLRSPGKP